MTSAGSVAARPERDAVAPASADARRINLLIAVAGLGIGGAEVVIRHLVQSIDRTRFTVTICCIKTIGSIGEELARQGIDVVTLTQPHEKKVNYLTFLRLLKLVRHRRIDVVHTHTTDALTDAAVCRLFKPGLKLVHTFHFGNYPHLDNSMLWMERVFSRLATRLYAVGEVQRRQLRAVYGFREHRIGVVLNGVPRAARRGDGSFRTRVGAGNRVLVGTTATLIEQKGLRDLLAVAARLRDDGLPVCFAVIGEGHLRSELEQIRTSLGLDETVVFTGWVQNAVDVALPDIDIFFQPSLWEAMSVAVLEAMAAGKAIVATRVGENGGVIDHEVNGLLVDAKDVDGMAGALSRLIRDDGLRQRFGQAAARKVDERFTVEHMTRTYEGVYREVVRGRHA